ncbi:cell wall protein DAN4-like isoform X2 [Perca fluviatilis]|uniref:cell wall protein DAN4-like isoform X2 n=1 Tax=Perca fluviatilis TaxID=8168 RepID=UPI001962501D|nr:cell wall protein DAN4-like isoform X2 [Perca fluviatilis]
MNVCQSLICFFFLTLQDGNIGLINAEIIESTGTEGGNITVRCSFTFPGKRRIFCKDECKDGDILIETEEDTAKKDRYSIEYKEGYIPVFKTILYVSIRNLTQSDSGRYRCGLFRFYSSSPSYWEIEIRVTDAPASPLRPSSPSVPSASTLMTSQSLSSTPSSASTLMTSQSLSSTPSSASTLMTSQSLSSTPSSASPEASEQPRQKHTAPGLVLYVRLPLVVLVIVLSVAALIFCRKRARKPNEPPLETEYSNVTEANRVYEEIREDRQSTSPPLEVSTVYTFHRSQFSEETPTSPLRPSSPSVPSASTLMTSQRLSSTPSSASPEASEQPQQKQTRALLYVALTLVLFFIMLSVALLIFCRMRARKPKEPPLETEYSNVTKANRVYEEIREDRQSTSPPVEVSTVYTYAKYTKPDGVESTEEYSLVTAPTSQKKTEDDWSDLTYSELDLPNGTAASLHSAPSGDPDNVVYSVPRVEASSAGSHAQDASPPLYSTVTLYQL